LGSIDFLKQAHVAEALPVIPWDVLVIDEAHDMCGTTERHDVCEALARRARHVLTLTATPHSGDAQRFSRLLTLGRMGDDEMRGVSTYTSRSRAFPFRGTSVGISFAPSEREARLLDALESYERAVLRAAGPSRVRRRNPAAQRPA
jgi:hypothetical protein